MKKYSLFALLLFFCFQTRAQIDVIWGGQQVASPKFSYISNIIGGNESRVYALKVKSRGWGSQTQFYLETYAKKSMSLISSTEFHLPLLPQRSTASQRFFQGSGKFQTASVERLFYLNGKFLLFTSHYDSDKQRNYAYVQQINENGSMEKNPVLLDSIDAESRRNKGAFDFVFSEDKSHILIFHHEPSDKSSNKKLTYRVIDENLNILWSKKIELPYRDQQFHISRYRIDNDGNVFMLANIDKNKDQIERKKPTYSYSILAYFYQSDQLKEYTIDLADKFISDITFNINPVGDIVCAGFYSKSSETAQAGTFFLKIDKTTKEVTEHEVQEFAKDFLMEFMTERKVEKGKELFNFDIGHLLLRPDGSAVMVAEQYYMDVTSYYNPATHSYTNTYNYYYNDIIVVAFDPKGQITLLKKISKLQHSVNDGGPYSSYVLVDGGDMLHFIYNDDPENVHRSESEIEHGHVAGMNNPGRSVVVLVSMNMKGNTQRQQLLDNHSKRNNCWFLPKMNKKIGEKDIVLFARRGKFYRFGRVSY
jgi:hypothetical protein